MAPRVEPEDDAEGDAFETATRHRQRTRRSFGSTFFHFGHDPTPPTVILAPEPRIHGHDRQGPFVEPTESLAVETSHCESGPSQSDSKAIPQSPPRHPKH